MAASKLSVELDEPNRRRIGGETITGTVVVRTEKDVKCESLDVSSVWATHGMGNMARGEAESQSLFQGTWQAGQEYRYPFKLVTATWPPTYYGNYLNVSHYVEARASVPWAIDPKTQTEFMLLAKETPQDLTPTNNVTKSTSWFGWVIGIIILCLFLIPLISLTIFLVPIAAIVGACVWFFKYFLPSRITGKVDFKTDSNMFAAGETVNGICEFTPRTNSIINGVTWTIRCNEICISGSGSNRKTHNHEVLCKVIQLLPAGPLQAGQTQRFPLSFEIPKSAPPSLKFSDNEVTWSSELRINIPKWPDWNKKLPFVVKVPPPEPVTTVVVSEPYASDQVLEEDSWLSEVLQQVIQTRESPEQLQQILAAVKDQVFAIKVNTQGVIDEPLDADIEDELVWISAVDVQRSVQLALCVPGNMNYQDLMWLGQWQGKASILGIDSDSGRVMMQLLP